MFAKNFTRKTGEWQAESGGVRVPATAIVGGNLGDIDLAGSAQRNLGFTVGAKLPDQSKAAALFGQPIAQFRSEQRAGIDPETAHGAPGAFAIDQRGQAVAPGLQ